MNLAAKGIFVGWLLLRGAFSESTDDAASASDESCPSRPRVSESCSIVWAPYTLENPSDATSWGVFSLRDRPRGTPVWPYGDVVIPVPDLEDDAPGIWNLAWHGNMTGTQFEGHQQVVSMVPGLGSLARSGMTPNLLPFAPNVDEGGLTRRAVYPPAQPCHSIARARNVRRHRSS